MENFIRFDVSGNKIILSTPQNNFLHQFIYNCNISTQDTTISMVSIHSLDHRCDGLAGLLYFIPCNFTPTQIKAWTNQAHDYGFCLQFYLDDQYSFD